ncbi:hypothetical protein M8A51_06220 [Schlegelella sp. S2-27]|uniref:Uncharacterized protein n=1 Tax=Caldimonas mangrovi TaxID=2944811 RepID=A0ABT0YKD9_9BURK|nr:hypothetical protein [Caldimonas mangrovi]MCM5679123.1 hypothetical protein [Caldimonas mangrovi]
MFLLKLGLVATSVLLASLAARRYGHGVAGALAGMPVIAGPIMLFVLVQQPAGHAAAIALATLVCLPATIAHLVVFALCATVGAPWWAGLAAANTAIVGGGWALAQLTLPAEAVYALALMAPAVGLLAMRHCARRAGSGPPVGGPVAIPRSELAWRVAAALVMAAAIMLGADVLPVMVSGLLLAIPIAGNVLPCFTLPRHGAQATVALLTGFVRGLFGFAAFFVVLHATLPGAGKAIAACAALAAALSAALAVHLLHQRLARR